MGSAISCLGTPDQVRGDETRKITLLLSSCAITPGCWRICKPRDPLLFIPPGSSPVFREGEMGMRSLLIGFALVLAVPLVGCAGGSAAKAPAGQGVALAAACQRHPFQPA